MNPFVTRISGNSWIVPVSLLSVVLIGLLRLAWITPANYRTRAAFLSSDQARRIEASFTDAADETKAMQEEVSKLRNQLTELQNAMGSKTQEAKALNATLQEVKLFAGLTEVEGPGLVITLRDARRSPSNEFAAQDLAIHDADVLKVVNELWNAGAEAISVNNQRISVGSNIRCVGSVIFVDQVRVAPPIAIRAVGDPQTLEGGMNLPLSVLDELRSVDPGMVTIEKVKNMRLPAFAGSTQRKIAKVPQGQAGK
jgi:uncharacterized protein YlxW (UPF0749 family)